MYFVLTITSIKKIIPEAASSQVLVCKISEKPCPWSFKCLHVGMDKNDMIKTYITEKMLSSGFDILKYVHCKYFFKPSYVGYTMSDVSELL